jgi:hypothetical protein
MAAAQAISVQCSAHCRTLIEIALVAAAPLRALAAFQSTPYTSFSSLFVDGCLSQVLSVNDLAQEVQASAEIIIRFRQNCFV